MVQSKIHVGLPLVTYDFPLSLSPGIGHGLVVNTVAQARDHL